MYPRTFTFLVATASSKSLADFTKAKRGPHKDLASPFLRSWFVKLLTPQKSTHKYTYAVLSFSKLSNLHPLQKLELMESTCSQLQVLICPDRIDCDPPVSLRSYAEARHIAAAVEPKPKLVQVELRHLIHFWFQRLLDGPMKAIKQNHPTRETQRACHPVCAPGEIDRAMPAVKVKAEQDARPRELSSREATDFFAEFDRIDDIYETVETEKQKIVSVLLNGYVVPHGLASLFMMGKRALSYGSFSGKQHSECDKNISQSPPVSGNRKAKDLWTGNHQGDKDPNGEMTVIAIRDEDEKRDYSYSSSFASAQFLTLAISSLLLCFMVLFPNFAKKYEAITGAALMAATLGSLVSLEAIPKWPNLARSCGYLAVVSLLVALSSILSASFNM